MHRIYITLPASTRTKRRKTPSFCIRSLLTPYLLVTQDRVHPVSSLKATRENAGFPTNKNSGPGCHSAPPAEQIRSHRRRKSHHCGSPAVIRPHGCVYFRPTIIIPPGAPTWALFPRGRRDWTTAFVCLLTLKCRAIPPSLRRCHTVS